MRKNPIRLTTAQFAKLHDVNKRTLHYYDSIGLFIPQTRGENGYRYYDLSQSVDFEYIRLLKELNMSMEEIEEYRQDPAPGKFLRIAEEKEKEISREIHKLKYTKKILQRKREQVLFCESLKEQEIRVEEFRGDRLYILPYDFNDDDIGNAISYVKDWWSMEQICMGIGGFISLEKAEKGIFEKYDGLFTPVLEANPSLKSMKRPAGKYLCGYRKGTWDHLPELYEKMFDYASQKNFKLTGYAYEIGLNEIVITDLEDYITKIMIQIKD